MTLRKFLIIVVFFNRRLKITAVTQPLVTSLPWALVLFLQQEIHLLPSLRPCKCLQKVPEFTRNGWGRKCRGVLPSALNVK